MTGCKDVLILAILGFSMANVQQHCKHCYSLWHENGNETGVYVWLQYLRDPFNQPRPEEDGGYKPLTPQAAVRDLRSLCKQQVQTPSIS